MRGEQITSYSFTMNSQGYSMNSSDSDSSTEMDVDTTLNGTLDSTLDGTHGAFDWRSAEDFYPRRHGFTAVPGVKVAVDDPTPLAVFRQFFTDELLETIVRETNRFADGRQQRGRSHVRKWQPTTTDELLVLFATTALMGIYPMPEMKMYWSKTRLLHTPCFHDLMPRDRFLQLLRALHFANNEDMVEGDRLSKLRPVVDTLDRQFQEVYTPRQEVVVDESLWRFKGRLRFRQYNPSKRARFGIKVFKLCQSTGPGQGYTQRFSIYTGQLKTTDLPASEQIVMDLTTHLRGKGYNLYLDNWFSSPTLFRRLFADKTNVTGTVRLTRKHMPRVFKDKPKLKKGERVAVTSGDLLAMAWKDKKNVNILTTMHRADISATGKKTRKGEPILKPDACIAYSKGMGGVDLHDQQAVFYKSVRKTVKWYRKVFFYLFDMTMVNSYTVWKLLNPHDAQKRYLQFKLDFIQEILTTVQRPTYSGRGRPRSTPAPSRLTERHFAEPIPRTGKYHHRRCHVCYSRGATKKTAFQCADCGDIPLCVSPCFKAFHTVDKY